MTDPKTHTLEVPGATLTYDVREAEASDKPILLLIGSPMDAGGFGTLSGHFSDRTVVTYDPRGVERSIRTDKARESTPELHAEDLSRLITEIGGPVDIFASSGGAVNGLALVTAHPEQVRTLVAHEPPAAQNLPDRENALAAVMDIRETYERDGIGPGMAKFIAIVSHKGEIPADFFTNQPPADPATFGLPTEDDGNRDDVLLAQNLVTCTHYNLDFNALRAAPTRIVVGIGVEAEGELARRSAEAVAERLGLQPVVFPGGHDGFLGGEYGMTGDPDAFAAKLHEVLDD
ncbi:alpha/beta hydrolase [Nocardia uniformis]|uniref:Alpha/beta hydrolase n=1 Tax=Nocardia uniformis TaxID=53432 RepID=A0A849C3G6_9NOCA|nr:alpha/beta hydrolase [Nocardia uniformis]NNH72298.1 alpha/beta hydrolase [Nocardia uniformis]